MNNKKDSVFIIDGSSFLYRAYYSIRALTTKSGMPVNAVYGFCRMIKKLVDTYGPEYIVVVWDSKGKTVRHELYEPYKQTRQAPPSDLFGQKDLIKEFADAIGLVQLQQDGIEADDLMYSITEQLKQENHNSILVTSDKDLRQVLSDKVEILDPFKEEFVTKESIEQKLGFGVNRIVFYYALIGDASDNIPGVKGVGPKMADTLVKQFESLEDLYNNIEKVESERAKKLLLESKEDAFISQDLFRLRFYETYLTKESCKFNKENWLNAKEIFQRLEFKSLLKEFGEEAQIVEPKSNLSEVYNFTCVVNPEELNEVCNEIKKHGFFALDTETDGLNFMESNVVGISICCEVGQAYYIPYGHKTDQNQLSQEYVLNTLRPYFEDENIKKVLHHAKFDALMLLGQGVKLKGIIFDTMIAASLLVGDGQKVGLKYLSDYYLKESMLAFADIIKKNKYKNFSYVPIDIATEYAAADAHQTLKLYYIFKKGLEELSLINLFEELEMPLMNVLIEMEKEGIKVDSNILNQMDFKVSQEILSLQTQIMDLIGYEFANINLNSPKQLESLLFDHLKLPVIKKTTQGTSYSTDQEVLKDLAKLHPVPALIMRYREHYKLKSTYIEGLLSSVNKKTGKIHTTFRQTSVSTGRLASSDPNLQNIPVDSFGIRSAFKPESQYLFLSADYSQIELRVLAYLSQDTALLNAFNSNQDIHALTAAGLFDVVLENVTSQQRNLGKTINFSILYGLTAHGLSKDLDISHSEAKSYIEKFMAQYPGVSSWMETVIEKTKEKGYVETLFGRRRYLPGIYEKNRTMYDLAKRAAINTVAQGTAAELVKIGMINMYKKIAENNLDAKILLQIHDELLIEVKQSQIEEVNNITQNILQNVVSWNVPLLVTIRTGKDWQEVTK